MIFGLDRTAGRIVVLCLVMASLFITMGLALVFAPDSILPKAQNILEHPNIVLIVLDAFRHDHLGKEFSGVALTPFLDALREQSAVFENAVTPCSWTRPAMASVYTAMHVDAHQVYYGSSPKDGDIVMSDVLSEHLPNMATYLKSLGFTTLGIQANGNLAEPFGFHHGFDVYNVIHQMDAAKTTAMCLESINNVPGPFFLYAHYMDTHAPYEPPARYREMLGYPPEGLAAGELAIVEDFVDYMYAHGKQATGRPDAQPFVPLSATGMEAVRTLYAGEVRYSDDELKRLITSIQAKQPNTIIIITADHGEHFWDHGFLGHGITLYDSELRVPLFVMGPNIQAQSIEHPVSIVNVLPTIAGLLNTQPLEHWQGNDLFNEAHSRPVFSHTRGPSPDWLTHLEMVIHDGMKLIVDHKRETVELYDWLQDPEEAANLAEERRETVEALQALLTRHLRENTRARRSLREETTLDPEIQEQLRRLGYMD